MSYYFEPDSAPCHTAAFDIESKQSEIINNYPASGIGFAENKIIFISDSDKSIYSTNFNSKETVHISEEPAQSMYIDSENEKIYFCNPNGIFTSEFDGTSCQKIYDGEIISINSDGEKLYFIRNDPYRKNYACLKCFSSMNCSAVCP